MHGTILAGTTAGAGVVAQLLKSVETVHTAEYGVHLLRDPEVLSLAAIALVALVGLLGKRGWFIRVEFGRERKRPVRKRTTPKPRS
ncbi:MAG TPA: hypothetical protein VF266_17205 [Thermoanaerobaculia bacterium]